MLDLLALSTMSSAEVFIGPETPVTFGRSRKLSFQPVANTNYPNEGTLELFMIKQNVENCLAIVKQPLKKIRLAENQKHIDFANNNENRVHAFAFQILLLVEIQFHQTD
ncbi:hypothetical protein [Parasitella parasitica]|uniref:Uncharacterized protein n=1 Tax=Parasitella parasitica TaxID=35722 RepID=A0A0B7N2I5_9FUNG|nr:hypothetical protein [Parasitella parasitica]